METENEKIDMNCIFIGNKKIAEVEIPKKHITNKESGLILYMKRGNNFYFKNVFGKKRITISPVPKEFIEMKYGDKVDIEWSKS